jgi:hypothetical protein
MAGILHCARENIIIKVKKEGEYLIVYCFVFYTKDVEVKEV